MTCDLAHGPALSTAKAVDFVDLFATQHGLLVTEGRAESQRECCWQEAGAGPWGSSTAWKIRTWQWAKVLLARTFAAGPNSQTSAVERLRSKAKLLFAGCTRRRFWSRCCWRWRFRSTARDALGGSVSNNRDAPRAIDGSCPSRPAGGGNRRRPSGGGNPAGGASGSRFGGKQIGWDDKGKVGRVAGSRGRDDRSSGGSGSRWHPLIVGGSARHPKAPRAENAM